MAACAHILRAVTSLTLQPTARAYASLMDSTQPDEADSSSSPTCPDSKAASCTTAWDRSRLSWADRGGDGLTEDDEVGTGEETGQGAAEQAAEGLTEAGGGGDGASSWPRRRWISSMQASSTSHLAARVQRLDADSQSERGLSPASDSSASIVAAAGTAVSAGERSRALRRSSSAVTRALLSVSTRRWTWREAALSSARSRRGRRTSCSGGLAWEREKGAAATVAERERNEPSTAASRVRGCEDMAGVEATAAQADEADERGGGVDSLRADPAAAAETTPSAHCHTPGC